MSDLLNSLPLTQRLSKYYSLLWYGPSFTDPQSIMRLLLLNHHCLLHAHLLNKQNLSHRSSKLNQIPYDDLSRVRTFNSRQSIVKTIHITTTIYHMFDLPAHTIPISLFSSTTSWFPSGNGPPLNFRTSLLFLLFPLPPVPRPPNP